MLEDGKYPQNRDLNPSSLAGLHLSNRAESPSPSPSAQSPTATDTDREPRPGTDAPATGKTESRPFRPLPQFRVLLHNDDLTEMSYVVRSITQLTFMAPARAYIVMMTAHTRGVALVTITHRERAELYQQQFRSKGLIVTIEAAE